MFDKFEINSFFNKNFGRFQRYTGFTLAEVLITLGVIGVVAAMTLPIMIQNSQKQRYITALKKFYTIFNQVLVIMANDYGCNGDLKCTGVFSDEDGNFGLTGIGKIATYFKTAKVCGNSTTSGSADCFPVSENYNYDGSSVSFDNANTSNGYKFITADGMSVFLWPTTNCSGAPGSSPLSMVCGVVYVDINGMSPPNLYGRDSFIFTISNGKGPMLYPYGGADDTENYWGGSTNPTTCFSGNKDGRYCAGRVIEEGWEMNY